VVPRKYMTGVLIIVLLSLFVGIQWVSAQSKFRYVDSQKILTSLPEYADVQKDLESENATWVQELQKMDQEIRSLKEQIEQQSLMLSDAKRKEKEQELQALYQKAQQYQNEKWGEQGEAFRKQQELLKPIVDKVQKVIDRIAEEEDYDYVFDSVAGNMLFVKPKFDITDDVIAELEKESPAKAVTEKRNN
jgi:outer membrane protein